MFILVCIVKDVNGRGIGTIFFFYFHYAKLVNKIFHRGGITVAAHVLREDALGKCD
jgi:hypothetical protein